MTQADERRYAGLSLDFWKFWGGQVISTFGASFTMFALPLLVYQLTHSSVNLAISAVSDTLPYLLFGLIIGAWVDRTDRKRLMILANLAFFILVISIPLLYAAGHLSIVWIYIAGFLQTTTYIAFNSAEFAAVPSLVPSDDLVTANGRIQASYQAATIIGPIIAGTLAALMPVVNLLYIDAATYIVSALTLLAVHRSFNQTEGEKKTTSLRADIVEGLRYVIAHPVLRNISVMMALVNFVSAPAGYELVLFAKRQLGTSNAELGILFAANGAGVVLTGLLAGRLRKQWTFGQVALGALMINGLLLVGFAFNRSVVLSVVLWGLIGGIGILFNINTLSLRQAIVPNDMLGRIMSIAAVLAWSAIPVGTLIGGFAIRLTGNVALVYAVMGALTFIIPVAFAFSPLGHAERYLPENESEAEIAG